MVSQTQVVKRKWQARRRAQARAMRHEPKFAEKLLWEELRDRRVGGFKFKRQHLIGNYIVDCVCLEARLIVELDGPVHELRKTDDLIRQAALQTRGFGVLRFKNEDVIQNLPAVLSSILQEVKRRVPSKSLASM